MQKAVKQCSDELQSEIDSLRKRLEANNKELKRKLVDLEKKMKSIGCVNNGRELLRAIFTLGLACLFDNDTKKEMMNVRADLREEQAIIQAISKRMNYFDDLLGAAETLVKESQHVLELTKGFKQALVVAKTVLERDYTPEDVEENLGDVDFANDFAMELWKTMDELKQEAQKVSDDCIQTKHRLDNALSGINKYFGEELEDVIELSSKDNTLGVRYNEISEKCSAYFDSVGQMVEDVQNGYINTVIENVQKWKNLFLLQNKDQYSDLKVKLMSVLDAARDVGLKIDSAQHRLAS